jgi:hypothetical protein
MTIEQVCAVIPARHQIDAFTMVHVEDGVMYGGDGRMTLSTLVDLPDFTCNGRTFAAARKQGDSVRVTEKSVIVTGGKFRAVIPRSHQPFPVPAPLTDPPVTLSGNYLSALREVRKFVSTDATQMWSMSIRHDGKWLYASNNATLVRALLTCPVPTMNLPVWAVDALLKHDGEVAVAKGKGSIVLDVGDLRIFCSAIALDWPNIDGFFTDTDPAKQAPAGDLVQHLKSLKPFGDFVEFTDEGIQCGDGFIEGAAPHCEGVYDVNVLALIADHAERIDFTPYPKPCTFSRGNLDGVFVGMTRVPG